MPEGWLILAHGNPKYLEWAANLICSIRTHSTRPVCLVTDQPLPRHCRPDAVVNIQHVPPFYAKTQLYDLSPFDHTIYLDADSLVVGPVDHLFDEPGDFDIHTVGHFPPGAKSRMTWADTDKMREFYGWKNQAYIETNSSYMRWRKGDTARKVFALAESLYASNFYPDWNSTAFTYYPDELAFNAALTFLEMRPPKGSPVLIHYRDSGLPNLAKNTKPIISLCGIDTTHGHLWNFYEKEKNRMFTKMYGIQGYKLKRTDKACQRGNVGRAPYLGLRTRDFGEIKRIMEHGRKEGQE